MVPDQPKTRDHTALRKLHKYTNIFNTYLNNYTFRGKPDLSTMVEFYALCARK